MKIWGEARFVHDDPERRAAEVAAPLAKRDRRIAALGLRAG